MEVVPNETTGPLVSIGDQRPKTAKLQPKDTLKRGPLFLGANDDSQRDDLSTSYSAETSAANASPHMTRSKLGQPIKLLGQVVLSIPTH